MLSGRYEISLVGLFGVALGLRLWGIGFGLPHLYHPDEWRLVMPALRILQTGDLNPHQFDYGSLQIYLLSGVYGLYFLYGRLHGLFNTVHDISIYGPENIRNLYVYAYPGVYLTGRILTAILGSLSVVIVYLIGRQLMSRQVGLIGALFLAFSPLHVVDSHYITADVPVTLFVTLGFLFICRILKSGTSRDYVMAGLLIGLAASTKYPGGITIVALVAAHLLRHRQGAESIKLLTGLLSAALGLVIATPFALMDFETWLYQMNNVSRMYSLPGLMVEGSSARWYLGLLLGPSHVFITLPGILGLLWMLRDGKREGWIVVTFLVAYFGLFSMQKARVARTLVPLLPFLGLLAGFLVVKSSTLIRQRWPFHQTGQGWLTGILTALLVITPLQASVGHAYRFTQEDVRTLAHEWVLRNLRPGAKIATDLAAPVLPPNQYKVDRVGWSIVEHPLSWYQEEGYEYLIVSSALRYGDNRTVDEEARYQAFLGNDALTILAEIPGHFLSYPGFRIWVYQLGPAS